MISPSYDLIIIGSGIAGLLTALNAPSKTKILIISKSRLNNCATNLAQGGIAAPIDPSDNIEQHIEDTIKAGHGINNKKAVKFIINQAPKAIQMLQKFGVNFDKSKSGLKLNMEAAHSHPRIVHVKDHTGKSIESALINKIKHRKNIKVIENCFTKQLLVKNKTCYGIEIIKSDKSALVFGKKTVLATGGLGRLYSKTTNPEISTGDGIAMAVKAGCKLKDMAYIQFHPTALNTETSPLFLLSETLRGAGAIIINKKGERILKKVHPEAELAPRDIISNALFKEKEVYLDMRPIGTGIIKKEFPTIYKKLLTLGFDCTKKPVPITPAAHYLCGGIITNLQGETTVNNLSAVGETACTGLHGANRLASNSLLEASVMSVQIAKQQPKNTHFNPNDFNSTHYKNQNISATTKLAVQKIRKIMWDYVGIYRTPNTLQKAEKLISEIKKTLPPPTCIKSVEAHNMCVTSLQIIKQAKSLSLPPGL